MRNKIQFVLVKPQIGENIGAAARSIKNFGFSKITIIDPRDGWPNDKAQATSVGAYDILDKAKIFNETRDALKKLNIVFSFSARKRDINKRFISLETFIKILKKKRDLNVGLMFGPEASGLSNKDLSYSNYVVTIPSSKNFRSLNLSHSIAIVAFEIFKLLTKKKTKKKTKFNVAKKAEINKVLDLLYKYLDNKNFFSPQQKRNSMIKNINNFFYRILPSDKELRILSSIFASLAKNKKKKDN
tara:strand:- start:1836 stop:2564 length:729 start_codon:yes stop_codon:yes gene_type:complete